MHQPQRLGTDDQPRPLQYSLRSILILMTGACVLLSLRPYVSVPRGVLDVLGILGWSAVVACQGVCALAAWSRYRTSTAGRARWSSRGHQAAVVLASLAAIAPVITLLLCLLIFYAGDFNIAKISNSFPSRALGSGAAPLRLGGPAALAPPPTWVAIWYGMFFLNPASVLLILITCMFYFRPGRDFPFFSMRMFGLISAWIATAVAISYFPFK